MTPDYAEYLRSPEWDRRRAAVLERDAYCCQDCGSQTTLHVHHLTYEDVRNEPHWQLITLCASCHMDRHESTFQRARNGATWDARGSATEWRRCNWPELRRKRRRRPPKRKTLSTREESFYAEDIHGAFGGDLRLGAEWLRKLGQG